MELCHTAAHRKVDVSCSSLCYSFNAVSFSVDGLIQIPMKLTLISPKKKHILLHYKFDKRLRYVAMLLNFALLSLPTLFYYTTADFYIFTVQSYQITVYFRCGINIASKWVDENTHVVAKPFLAFIKWLKQNSNFCYLTKQLNDWISWKKNKQVRDEKLEKIVIFLSVEMKIIFACACVQVVDILAIVCDHKCLW